MSTTEHVDALETADAYPKYDEYRDSGTEWIGEIPSHWDSVKFAYMIRDSNAGEVIDKTHWGEGDELLYSCRRTPIQSSFSDFPDDRRATEEDLLVTRNGTPYVHLPREDAIYTNVVQRLRIAEDLNRRFGWYCLSQAAHTLQGVGDIIESFNLSTWRNLRISLPPRDEQRAIAAYLDRETERIDALIEKKEQLIELLEEKRTALLSRVVTQGLDGDVEMQDSGVEWLGEIPEHWDTVKLKWNTDKIGSGVTPDGGSEAYVDDGITFLRSQNVHFDGLRLDDVAYIDEETDRDMESTRVYPGDVLLNITGASIGRCTLVPKDFPRANVNQHVCIIRPQQDELHPSFLNHVMASSAGQNQIFAEIDGASRDAVTFAEIGNFIVPKPPKEEQARIAEYIAQRTSQIYALIEQIEEGIELLKEYRTALISAAVTGQIDARNMQL